MVKSPAVWSARDGSSTITQAAGGALLLETGGYFLLETGGHLLLEDIRQASKENTLWDNPTTKASAGWINGTAALTNTGVQRTQENGTVRTLENGTIRVLEDVVITPKANSSWHE